MQRGYTMELTENQKKAIDLVGKSIAALAGFLLADRIFMGGTITPEALRPLAGWPICIGAAILSWRLVKS